MLTAKIGETIINCFDGKYDKYTLKKWSDKNKLKCPDCDQSYEYCHGEFVIPYFRHKEKSKDCDEIYSEPETVEHLTGKLTLYNWLLKMQEAGIIEDLKLESYIVSTKQRPDIYFMKNNEKYVIEFQCTPIATEYLERHELYRLADINDIWILGLDKYNLKMRDTVVEHSVHYKAIERYTNFYLNTKSKDICIGSNLIENYLPHRLVRLNRFYVYNIDALEINDNHKTLFIKQFALDQFIFRDNKEFEREQKEKAENGILNSTIDKIVNSLNSRTQHIHDSIMFTKRRGDGLKYRYAIEYISNFSKLTFFIKRRSIDCCTYHNATVPFRGKRGGTGWRKVTKYNNVASSGYEKINEKDILAFIERCVSETMQIKI